MSRSTLTVVISQLSFPIGPGAEADDKWKMINGKLKIESGSKEALGTPNQGKPVGRAVVRSELLSWRHIPYKRPIAACIDLDVSHAPSRDDHVCLIPQREHRQIAAHNLLYP